MTKVEAMAKARKDRDGDMKAMPHVVGGDLCWCRPKLKKRAGGWVMVHRSAVEIIPGDEQ